MSRLNVKVGDKVKLLIGSSILTTNKIYEIINYRNGHFWVECDDNVIRYINPDSHYWEIVEQKEDINYLELIKGY